MFMCTPMGILLYVWKIFRLSRLGTTISIKKRLIEPIGVMITMRTLRNFILCSRRGWR